MLMSLIEKQPLPLKNQLTHIISSRMRYFNNKVNLEYRSRVGLQQLHQIRMFRNIPLSFRQLASILRTAWRWQPWKRTTRSVSTLPSQIEKSWQSKQTLGRLHTNWPLPFCDTSEAFGIKSIFLSLKHILIHTSWNKIKKVILTNDMKFRKKKLMKYYLEEKNETNSLKLKISKSRVYLRLTQNFRGIANTFGWTVEIEADKHITAPTASHFLHDAISEIENGISENR